MSMTNGIHDIDQTMTLTDEFEPRLNLRKHI